MSHAKIWLSYGHIDNLIWFSPMLSDDRLITNVTWFEESLCRVKRNLPPSWVPEKLCPFYASWETEILAEKMYRTYWQSASPSWQCNTSGNLHQPAMQWGCMEWTSGIWYYVTMGTWFLLHFPWGNSFLHSVWSVRIVKHARVYDFISHIEFFLLGNNSWKLVLYSQTC